MVEFKKKKVVFKVSLDKTIVYEACTVFKDKIVVYKTCTVFEGKIVVYKVLHFLKKK